MSSRGQRCLTGVAGLIVAIALLLAMLRPLSVVAGFLSGFALGGVSAASLSVLGRALVTKVTSGRSKPLLAWQLAKWPFMGLLIYLLVGPMGVDPVAMAIGYGLAMLTGLILISHTSPPQAKAVDAERQ